MSDPYRPIDCGEHDRLLDLSTRRRSCALRYRDDSGVVLSLTTHIADVFTRAGAEFLTTGDGRDIRLDRLIEVDGRVLAE
ncbi:MAG: hypothetical protein IPK72_13450 [Candidatus Eisenbacteria bacterium]|nr:hypothetical protein [Candidatus Eisenbacteria bacterium]